METIALWVTIGIGVFIPLLGFIFNSLITKKIDRLEEDHEETKKQIDILKEGITDQAKEGFKTVFKRFDDYKDFADNMFVRQKEYNLAREYQEKQTDQKISSSVLTLTTQIQALENRVENTTNNISEKIEDIRDMMKELKTNGKNIGG